MPLDTLRIARELRDADVAPARAEAIAAPIGNAVGEGAASQADVEKLLAKIDGLDTKVTLQIDALEQRVSAKMERIRSSLFVWMIGVTIAGAGLLFTIGKTFLQ